LIQRAFPWAQTSGRGFNHGIFNSAPDLRRFQEVRDRLEAALLDDQAKLAELRGGIADSELSALVDGSDPAPLRQDIAALEQGLTAKRAALPKLQEKIREGIRAQAHAAAEVIRKEASKKERELETYAKERGQLIEALQSFTGCRWQVEAWDSRMPFLTAGAVPTFPGVDRGVALSAEIRAMRSRADSIEEQAGRDMEGGQCAGRSLEELLSKTAPFPLAPARARIEFWFLAEEVRAIEQHQREYPDGMFYARDQMGHPRVGHIERDRFTRWRGPRPANSIRAVRRL
jgi:hypothetical protein